jgi:hypothetical protein
MEKRDHVPDVGMLAEELLRDYRADPNARGWLDAVGTLSSYIDNANTLGDGFTQDDWTALVLELVRRLGEATATDAR